MDTNFFTNIKCNVLSFENISYDQWKTMVEDVLNYDIQLSNIKNYDKMLLLKKQLETYIDCKGIIPSKYQSELQQLKDTELKIKKIKKDIEIAEVSSNFQVQDQEQLSELEHQIHHTLVKDGQLIENNPIYFYFNNPYFLEDNQKFEQRLPSLKYELKNINWIIKKELKPSFKKSLRMMKLIAVDIRRILHLKDKNFNIQPLIEFVHPYTKEIVNSEDYFYHELLAMSL